MSKMSVLNETASAIRTMKVRGALDIALAAIQAMDCVLCEDANDTASAVKKLSAAAVKLKSARPSAVSLPNAVNYIAYLSRKNRDLDLDDFRKTMSSEIKRFAAEQEKALEKIAGIGAKMIEDGDVILTHCNSETVMRILEKAWEDEKRLLQVVCTESRPRYQGHLSAKELSSAGIPVTLIIDSAVHLSMKRLKVDKVMVGADTVCANGDLINKIGTAQVALCAKEQDIDFIVAAESLKFSPGSVMGSVVEIEERDAAEVVEIGKLPNVRVMNPAFDVTDAEYISMIITEYGVIPPQAAYHLLKEKFGWELDV